MQFYRNNFESQKAESFITDRLQAENNFVICVKRAGETAEMVYESTSAKQTAQFAAELAKTAAPGMIICLEGDLGVGKTVFTQGFARGLGIVEPVSSPTFTIVQVYEEGRLPLYHFDVYRIADVMEMEEIGYEDYFYGQGVCLVEWSSRISEILPEQVLSVRIEKDLERDFDFRRIIVE